MVSGTLGSVIQDSLFFNGSHSIKYGYVAVSRKQQESGCLSLFVGFRQCVGYPLAKLVRLPYAVQVKSDCFIRNQKVFGKLTTGSVVVFLYGRLHSGLVAGHCRGSSLMDRSSDLNFWKQCLAVRLLIIPKDVRRLYTVTDKLFDTAIIYV